MKTIEWKNNPFAVDQQQPVVHVAGGGGPYDNTRAALSRVDLRAVAGLRVLIKPNTGRVAAAGSGVVTHPEVVAAAIDAFTEAGALVSVGESGITGVDVMEAFEASGVAAVVRKRGRPLLDMDKREAVDVPVPDGKAIRELKVCVDVLDHDLVVSIPVMKTHMHTRVTLAVKNMKGCLWRRSKVELHMLPRVKGSKDKPLDVAIADMATVLRPHLAVIDGTVGMEGLGPGAGEAKELGAVVVGADPFAADAVACELMGEWARNVPHLRIAAARGCGVIDLERIVVTPADWKRWLKPFAPAPANLSIKFPDVEVLDRNSCSACQSTVLLFLQKYSKELFDYFPDKPVRIAIGKGHKDVPPGTLCIGNCTIRHQTRGTFVSGCPPVGSTILKAILARGEGGRRSKDV